MSKLPNRIELCRHHPIEQAVISIKAEGAGIDDETFAMVFEVGSDRLAAAERIVQCWNASSERRAMYAANAPITLDDARAFFVANRSNREISYNWTDLIEALAVLRFQYADKMLELESAQ